MSSSRGSRCLGLPCVVPSFFGQHMWDRRGSRHSGMSKRLQLPFYMTVLFRIVVIRPPPFIECPKVQFWVAKRQCTFWAGTDSYPAQRQHSFEACRILTKIISCVIRSQLQQQLSQCSLWQQLLLRPRQPLRSCSSQRCVSRIWPVRWQYMMAHDGHTIMRD